VFCGVPYALTVFIIVVIVVVIAVTLTIQDLDEVLKEGWEWRKLKWRITKGGQA
jgi:hypothetical protein